VCQFMDKIFNLRMLYFEKQWFLVTQPIITKNINIFTFIVFPTMKNKCEFSHKNSAYRNIWSTNKLKMTFFVPEQYHIKTANFSTKTCHQFWYSKVLTSSTPSTCIHVIFFGKKCLFLWNFFTDMGLEWSQDWIYASILVKNAILSWDKTSHVFMAVRWLNLKKWCTPYPVLYNNFIW